MARPSFSTIASGYHPPVILAPFFDESHQWKSDNVCAEFAARYGNAPLVAIGTGIIGQGLHEFTRVHNLGFHTGGVDHGLDVTSKRSIRGFLGNIIRLHGLKSGDSLPVFNGAAFLSANPNVAGSIDVNVGGALNLIIVSQEIMKSSGINVVILTPSSIARNQLTSPYGTGKRLVENLTSFQNLSTPTDFRSVILPGVISGLNPIGGSTDTYDGLAKHVAHLVIYANASEADKPHLKQVLDLESEDFISFVRVDRKVAMAGIKDVVSSIIQSFSLRSLPKPIPICGGVAMSYSVDDAERALKAHLGSAYPTFQLVEKLGIQQKNLEDWGETGTALLNVDDEYNISTTNENLDISVVNAYSHYKKVALDRIKQ